MRKSDLNVHMRAMHSMSMETWQRTVAMLIRRRKLAGRWTAEDEASEVWEVKEEVTNFKSLRGDKVDAALVAWSDKYFRAN